MKVYLAGPEVFSANAQDIGEAKRAICAAHGLQASFPIDDSLPGDGQLTAARLFAVNIALIRGCDCVIANLTPFRSVSADVGTAFEVGAAYAIGKPVFGYSNDARLLVARVAPDGMAVEDFGGFDNLMLTEALSGFASAPEGPAPPHDDLAVFETCVGLAAASFSENLGIPTTDGALRDG